MTTKRTAIAVPTATGDGPIWDQTTKQWTTAQIATKTDATALVAGLMSSSDKAKLDLYPSITSLTTGHVLLATSASTAAFGAPDFGTGSTVKADSFDSSSSTNVAFKRDGTTIFSLVAGGLTWASTLTTPTISQAQASGTAAGQASYFSAQAAGTSATTNTLGGDLVLSAGADNGVTNSNTSFHAAVIMRSGTTEIARFKLDGQSSRILDFGNTVAAVRSDNADFYIDTQNASGVLHMRVGSPLSDVLQLKPTSIEPQVGTVTFSSNCAVALTTAQASGSGAGLGTSITTQSSGTTAATDTLAGTLTLGTGSDTVTADTTHFHAPVVIKCNGTEVVRFQVDGQSPTPLTSIKMVSSGQLLGSGNMNIKSSSALFIDALGGTITFRGTSSGTSFTASTSALTFTAPALTFVQGVLPVISHAIRPTDAAAQTMTVQAQSAFASASTNLNGGMLHLQGGARASASGTMGGVRLQWNASTTQNAIECVEMAAGGRRVVALCTITAVTTTNLPTSTGDGVVFLANAQIAPTATPVGGGILYSSGGELYWYGTSGTSTKLANA